MRDEPFRRIPGRCFYCGSRVKGAWTCGAHRSVFEADPLGRSAHKREAMPSTSRAEAS